MTAGDLTDLLTGSLAKTHGGSRRSWRAALGAIKILDRGTHPHCNWSVAPSGTRSEISAIEDLLDDVRLSHPFVTAG